MQSTLSVFPYVAVAMLLSPQVPAFALDAAAPQADIARPSEQNITSPADDAKADETKADVATPDPALDRTAKEALCLIIESAAKANDLPLEFFVRVIWQESRFQPNVVGPITRSGQRAQGIAQFMPDTASERMLLNPFDPVQALPKSAEFLNELRKQFGNLGLAAAAYNAGPRRVQDWLAGSGEMPRETRNYVLAITGSSVDSWARGGANDKLPDPTSSANCHRLLAELKSSPNNFVTQLRHSVTHAAAKLWGVQIAAGFNRDNALAMYARAVNGLGAIVGEGNVPLLIHSPGTTTFYHVQIGTDTHREADDLCSRLRRAGGACLVKRNTSEAPRLAARGHVVRRAHANRHAILPAQHQARPL